MKTKIGMKPKKTTTRKKKKWILPTMKRGVTFSANVGRAWVRLIDDAASESGKQ